MSYSRRQLEAFGEPLGGSVTRKEGGRIIYGGGGGGGGTSTQVVDLPEWAKPTAQKQLALTEATTDINKNPFQSFGGIKDASGKQVGFDATKVVAGQDPLQQTAYQGAKDLQTSPQLGQASGLMGLATQRALDTSYNPGQFQNQYQGFDPYQSGQFQNQFQAPGQYQTGQFQNQFQAPDQYQSGQFNADRVQAAGLQNYQMAAPASIGASGYDAASMKAAQTGYNPELQAFQMGPAERLSAQNFGNQSAQDYMSPYMQQVVDVQQREARRASEITRNQQQAQAVGQGAFGGSRQAIVEAERQRNLGTQLGDIQSQGLQSAFSQAQQQFNTDQARQMAAQQANQQAGLTVGQQNLASQMGTQQLGTQTGLQTSLANLTAAQQAEVNNQAAKNQAMGMNAQMAMQAAIANQQTSLATGQQNLAANLAVQQLGAGQSMQAQLANQQQSMEAQRLGEQSRQFGAGQGLTAAQNAAQFGLAAQQAGEASRQFGAGQAMTAAQNTAQFGLAGQQAAEASRQFASSQAGQQAAQRAQFGQAAQQLGEQSRQYGAGLGIQGLQTAMTGAGQLGALGQQQFGQQRDIIGLQNQFGAQQQAQEQALINAEAQNFAAQQRYPYQQLEFMSNILRGTPMGTVQSMYQPQPGVAQQLVGAGTALYGANQLTRAKGGTVRSYAKGGSVKKKSAGLAELALSKI
jgi:hypothetical protein